MYGILSSMYMYRESTRFVLEFNVFENIERRFRLCICIHNIIIAYRYYNVYKNSSDTYMYEKKNLWSDFKDLSHYHYVMYFVIFV